MFKRVERKRKRREKEAELGLDEDTKEILGLHDTDSDESDSGSEQENAQSDLDGWASEDVDHDQDDAMYEDESSDENPPISVEEALKDQIYLISLDPTAYGCIVCKGKLIKNAGMATAHKNANVHKRHLEHFRRLCANVDPRSSAWELVRKIQSASSVQRVESQELSKRALKRQAKQANIRAKRKRHKELKAKALAKKAVEKLSAAEETGPAVPSKANSRHSLESRNQLGASRKKRKLQSKTPTSKVRDVGVRSALKLRPKTPGTKKSALKSRIKSTGKADKPS